MADGAPGGVGDRGIGRSVQLEPEDSPTRVSTGELPTAEHIERLLDEAYQRYRDLDDGAVADYIPVLAAADPHQFGICIAGVRGATRMVGDALTPFSIQSISKVFVYALACRLHGDDVVRRAVGVNSTGLPFDSVMAVELNAGMPMNPMVNAGAIATTALIPGDTVADRFELIRDVLGRFAGHPLELDQEVYESEMATNRRNLAIARLLQSYGRIEHDSIEVVDVYTRQCSLRITAADLAMMGATLADGGVHPVTGEQVLDARTCRVVLAVMTTAGLYEGSGDWLYDIGTPGKSGVSGGILAVSPGKGALAVFSPPLDHAGNSVRGQRVARFLSRGLGLDLFASEPVAPRP
jgi:glutaminase